MPALNHTSTSASTNGPAAASVSRRRLLQGSAAGLGGVMAAAARPGAAGAQSAGPLLVVVFLRGGFDGLSAVVPVNDGQYYTARPTIAVPAAQTVPLNGTYALNRHLAGLQPLYDAGQMAVVLGAGAPFITRSHFEDMNSWERAMAAGTGSGWLGRHLATSRATQGTFRAVTSGDRAVLSLSHPDFDTLAISNIKDFDLWGWDGDGSRTLVKGMLKRMYADAGGQTGAQARTTFAAIDGLAPLRAVDYVPANGAVYPKNSSFATGLRDVAQMTKAGLGLEVACVDFGGWDMHQNLGLAANDGDWFSRKARELGNSLAAFARDMGPLWGSTTVVVMSEFGRRVGENGDRGLDHGTGNTMFVLGGGLLGGRVLGGLPSLAPANLYRGDVPVAVDYRQVLTDIITFRLGNGANLPTIFPGYTSPGTLGLGRLTSNVPRGMWPSGG